MPDIKVGDHVSLKSPLWHNGQDVGSRLGEVISIKGHILVNVFDYPDNPVKCFRNEIDLIIRKGKVITEDDDDMWEFF